MGCNLFSRPTLFEIGIGWNYNEFPFPPSLAFEYLKCLRVIFNTWFSSLGSILFHFICIYFFLSLRGQFGFVEAVLFPLLLGSLLIKADYGSLSLWAFLFGRLIYLPEYRSIVYCRRSWISFREWRPFCSAQLFCCSGCCRCYNELGVQLNLMTSVSIVSRFDPKLRKRESILIWL